MFLRKLSWAQLTKGGVPPMFVLRPLRGGFTPPNIGDPFPSPDPMDKYGLARARQLYEQRRIGTEAELDLALSKVKAAPAAAAQPARPAKHRKEKTNG